ncbi:MAG: acyl-CoA thioesterase [Thiomicrorhabdus chilensis]|uniref:acyl-CoA thioesterase n=1 Tax=Thiomicrorhabdus chilensis TaxID=63656 RepID=UPI00299F22AE|nr:acyl-CoA thioesterase [Thiomicrorhabdus chilensis]MDX1346800.1 acyl-CoA thioesterase [Thiomicrorhabdus chilensis]
MTQNNDSNAFSTTASDWQDMDWQAPHPFIWQHVVTADELDFLNHVNNKSYLVWMEQVAWKHSQSVGINHDTQKRLNRIMAVYENCMQYKASCYLGDELLIGTWVGEQKGYCLRTRNFQIIRPRDGKTVFTAQATYVCIDLKKHKPKPIPKAFIEPYQAR